MARKAKVAVVATDALLEKYKDFPGLKIIERRLESPDIPGSLPILLMDEPAYVDDPLGARRKWYLRWVNGGEAGRYSQITDVMGYVPVQVSELQNPSAVLGVAESKDGIVRRGDKGQEVLVKMPLELYTRIKQTQRELRQRRDRNATLVKRDLVQATGSAFGEAAADAVEHDFSLTLKHHKSTLGDELDGDVTEA